MLDTWNYPGFEETRLANDAMSFRADHMHCRHCEAEVCLVDDDADLVGLIRLASRHLRHCEAYRLVQDRDRKCGGPTDRRYPIGIDPCDCYSFAPYSCPDDVTAVEPGEVLHADEFTGQEGWQVIRNLAKDDPAALATVHAGFVHLDGICEDATYRGVSPLVDIDDCDLPTEFGVVTVTALVALDEKSALVDQLLTRYLKNTGKDLPPLDNLRLRLAGRRTARHEA